MRVLAVTSYFPHAGDPQRAVFVANLVAAMRRRAEVEVVSPLPWMPPLPPGWLRPDQAVLRRVPRIEHALGSEVLHPRYLSPPGLFALAGAGYALGTWRTLSRAARAYRPDVMHVHCAYPDGVGAGAIARLLGLPVVLTVHGSDLNVHATRPGIGAQVDRALRRAAGVVAVSAPLAAAVRKRAPAARVAEIPCAGIDPAVFAPLDREARAALRDAAGIAREARVIVFAGQLVPVKGVEILVRAFARLAHAGVLGAEDRLVVIGDGPAGQALAREAAERGIALQARFPGSLPQAEVARWMQLADFFCLPSRSEGTPNVVVEALATGVPVIATRVGGVPALIDTGNTGILVAPGDAGALADALAAALSRHWDRAAAARAVAHLTWEAIADRNVEFLAASLRAEPGGGHAVVAQE